MADNVAQMQASIVLDKKELRDDILQGLRESQKIVSENDLIVKIAGDVTELKKVIAQIQKINPEIKIDLKVGNEFQNIKNDVAKQGQKIGESIGNSVSAGMKDGANIGSESIKSGMQEAVKETQKAAQQMNDALGKVGKGVETHVSTDYGKQIDELRDKLKYSYGDFTDLDNEIQKVGKDGNGAFEQLEKKVINLSSSVKPLNEVISRISKNSSIKDIPFDGLAEEAGKACQEMIKLSSEGKKETEEYLTNIKKIFNIIDRNISAAGGVKRSGASSLSELRSWIFKSLETDSNGLFNKSFFVDELFSTDKYIDATTNKLRTLTELVGDIFGYKGTKFSDGFGLSEDKRELEELNKLLTYIRENRDRLFSKSVETPVSSDTSKSNIESQTESIKEQTDAIEKNTQAKKENDTSVENTLSSDNEKAIQNAKELADAQEQVAQANEKLSSSAVESENKVSGEENTVVSTAEKMAELASNKKAVVEANEKLANTAIQSAQDLGKEEQAAKETSTAIDKLANDFQIAESKFGTLQNRIAKDGLSSDKLNLAVSNIDTDLKLGVDAQTEESIKRINEQLKIANAEVTNLKTGMTKWKLTEFTNIDQAMDAIKAKKGVINSYNKQAQTFNATMKHIDGTVETVRGRFNALNGVVEETVDTKRLTMFERTIGRLGESLKGIIRIYLSPSDLIRYASQGVSALKEYDSALTTINYTTKFTKQGLDNLGQSVLDLADELNSSVDDAMSVAQIYANMTTTAEEIMNAARPTLVLSNLTGTDASTAADQIQAVIQQFGVLEEESMHIADVYDYISGQVAIDYAKGIDSISQAVEIAGATAVDAGLSFEQLSAIVAKVAEKTRAEGSQIGNALKTITVRLSKASKLSGADEVDNETLSKASAALKEIGIEVYNLDGSFREFDTVMSELAEQWDNLTDAQQSNLSYEIAATRQTNMFKTILNTWSDSMNLAAEATEANGNALENEEKYLDSFGGKQNYHYVQKCA